MQFTTIEQIKQYQFTGCHAFDREAMEAVDQFALDQTNSIADRAEALRIICDQAMGAGRLEDLSDQEVVQAHNEPFKQTG